MNNKIKKSVATIVFGLASMGTSSANEPPQPDNNITNITYLPFSSADIRIPTYNQRHLPDGRVQFDIKLNDFSGLKYLFARTMVFFNSGQRPPNDHTCPYVTVPDEQVIKEFRSDGSVSITITVEQTVVDAAKQQGCVIANKP